MTPTAVIAILIMLVITAAAVWVTWAYAKDKAYDAETIRSLREQLGVASRNDHRDARGRYDGA